MQQVKDQSQDSAGQVAQAMARLFRALGIVRGHLVERAHSQGVSMPAFIVLRALVQSGPQRSRTLAETLYLDPSWISRQVAYLVERHLVERHADRKDGRVCILAATTTGAALYAQLQQSVDEYMASLVTDWPEQDRQHLSVLLERLAGELEASAQVANVQALP